MTTNPDSLQRLLAEEPFVRALAHSLVADEADDVVQQAFLRALERPGAVAEPRSWLARIVRNLAVDLRRRGARRDARHRASAPHGLVPSSSELLEGEEWRRALVAAVDALPADQRTVVLLRYYDGLPPRRIAAQLGVPVATVWNRLHAALQTLRARLDAEHGDRRAWLLPLVPFATAPRALPWRELAAPAAKTLLGAIVMTTKTKIVAAVAAVLALAVAWVAWPRDDVPAGVPQVPAAGAGGPVAQHGLEPARDAGATTEAPTRDAVDAPKVAAATTGSLVVKARYSAEPTAAAGITILVSRPGGDLRVGVPRAVTDAEGTARFDALVPGKVSIWTPAQSMQTTRAEIVAGSTSESTLELKGGMTLSGIVVDAGGVPVGGALVEAGSVLTAADADHVASTAGDGTFTLRECWVFCVVGARAEGHSASQLYWKEGKPGSTEHVRIELRPNGGTVEGLVVGPTGEPVAGAVVRVGEGSTVDIRSTPQGAPPLPAQVRTDAAGRFRAVGVAAGSQPVQVRTVDLAPWRGTCEVAAGRTVAVRIHLVPGVACSGIVRSDDGQTVPGASVSVGDTGDFVLLRTKTATDGTFALTGLPVGDFVLAAQKEKLGKAAANLRGESGATLRCELQLGFGLALRARVVDEAGAPIAQVEVRVEAEGAGPRWTSFAFSGQDGRCLIADCPPGRTLSLVADTRDYTSVQRQAVQPGGAELELRLVRDTAPKARITGSLLRPDGSPATGETVEAWRSQTATQAQLVINVQVRKDGTFVSEVPAGEWNCRVLVKNHPEIRFSTGKLEAGGAFDTGVLQITNGGTLVVRDDGAAGKYEYWVFDAREQWVCVLYSPAPPQRSDLLAPGEYVMLATGEGLAAQQLPFTIRSGAETELNVTRIAGVRQWIEFELPPGTEPPSYIEFQVRRGAALVASSHARAERGAPFRSEVWLAPGSYTLTTKNREPQATASFTVGPTEGPPVRIVLK